MAGLNKVTVDDIDVKGKKVLVRVDFNVPMKDGVITNDNRIQAALPTIQKLVSEGGKVMLSPRQAEEWPGSKVLSKGCCRTPCRTGCSDKGYFRTV